MERRLEDKKKTRKHYVTLEAIDPRDGKRWDVLVSLARVNTVAARGMLHAMTCAHIVPEILVHPRAIFEGLRRDEDEDRRGDGWICYSGTPRCAYNADGTERPPWPDEVFLVFVNDDRVAYNWRWEEADPSSPGLPRGHKNRFQKRVL